MRIVAVLAIRRVVMAGFERDAVDAGLEARRLASMTDGAIHRRDRLVVVGVLRRDVRMATDTGVRAVDGELQLACIHEKRDGLAGGIGLEQRVIAVTIKTVAILQAGKNGKRDGQQHHQRRHEEARIVHAQIFAALIALTPPFLATVRHPLETYPHATSGDSRCFIL